MLPNKPRGVRRVNDLRVLKRIFWVLRSGAPWRDLPENYGPYTTCYNRFVRWRQAGIWPWQPPTMARFRWSTHPSCVCTSTGPASQGTENGTWAGREVRPRPRARGSLKASIRIEWACCNRPFEARLRRAPRVRV